MPRRAQCQENQYVCPLPNSKPFIPPSCIVCPDKFFAFCIKSKQVSHKCKNNFCSWNFAALSGLCAKNTSAVCISRILFQFRSVLYLRESDLIVHNVMSVREAHKGYTAHRKAISFTSNRGKHVPVVEWTQETNCTSYLVIGWFTYKVDWGMLKGDY